MEQLFRPQFTGATPEENWRQLTDYLYQVMEQIEFAFDNISEDNLSPSLLDTLNKLGAGIDANATLTSETQSRVGSLDLITVSDVINSPLFTAAMASQATTLRGDMDTKDNAVKQAVLPVETTGAITFPSGTQICYGTANGDTQFPKAFGSIPKVVGYGTFTVSTTGITTTDTFDYIAIGEEA